MTARKILIGGSLHHDVVVSADRMPQIDETLPGTSVRYVFGGKGRNQAVAAAKNGAVAIMAGRIGSDAAGAALSDDLRDQGVDISLLQTGAGEASGMSVAILLPNGDYGAIIVSAANLDFDADATVMPGEIAYMVLQNEIPEAANISLARKARQAGGRVILNAAPYRPLSSEFMALIDILVVNRVEAAMLSGSEVREPAEAMVAAQHLCQWAEKVIVTLGGEGVVHMRRDGRPEPQPAFRADVISTHGAGDFFIGALTAQLAAGSDFEAAIHYAQSAAAVFISTEVDRRDAIRPVHIRARLGED